MFSKNQKELLKRLKTELELERTILSKQRTLLSEISILLSLIGLGLFTFKLFENLLMKIIGIVTSLISIYIITKLFHSYKMFQLRIGEIDKRYNRFIKL